MTCPAYQRGLRREVQRPANLSQRRWLQVCAALGQGPNVCLAPRHWPASGCGVPPAGLASQASVASAGGPHGQNQTTSQFTGSCVSQVSVPAAAGRQPPPARRAARRAALRLLLRHCPRPRLALLLHAVAAAPLASLESVLLPPSHGEGWGAAPRTWRYISLPIYPARASPPNQSPPPFR